MSIETMRAQVDKVLGEPVGDHDNLLDARLDSIRLMMLVCADLPLRPAASCVQDRAQAAVRRQRDRCLPGLGRHRAVPGHPRRGRKEAARHG